MPTAAAARIIAPWGSSLTAPPNFDTANGASHGSGDRPRWHEIDPYPHDGSDIALWNVRVAHGTPTAPSGGQVRAVRVKGCAMKDTTAPTQLSLGAPVNTVSFQTLTRRRDGSYKVAVTAGPFQVPFCSNSANPARGRISASAITTFRPIHMCIARGDTVGLYGLGGFVPNLNGPSWYPEGVPLKILAGVPSSSSTAFVDADLSKGVYSRGAHPRGANSGFGSNRGLELMIQALEGVGADAYGLCPGGTAEEPTNSNAVICAARPPLDGQLKCSRAADPAVRQKPFR
jgi:hypothetical protein